MRLLFSIPTGYHLRELVMPLRAFIEQDADIEQVYAITPAALHRDDIFRGYSSKFEFIKNPVDIEGHKQLFDELRPNVVITDTVGHDPLDFPILRAAKDLRIPTVTFIASWDNVWKIERMQERHMPLVVADHIIVWNTMMRDHMLRIFPDLLPQQVTIIGAPRMDYFWHTENIPSKEELYAYLGFQDTRRPLIHFSTTELYPMDYVVKAVTAGIKSGAIPGNPYLYASVHPGGNMDNHVQLAEYGVTTRYSFGRQEKPILPEFAYLPSEEELYMLVALFIHAGVLINHSSSTALESLLGRTPVINVKFGRPFDWWRWYRSMVYRDFKQHYIDLIADGATHVVTSERQLIAATADSLKNPNKVEAARQNTIKRMITTVDGTASEKVLAYIKSKA